MAYEEHPHFQTIRQFIEQTLIHHPIADEDCSRLMSGEIVDSFQMLDLAAFLEERFGLAIPEKDLNVRTFDSIGGLVRMIEAGSK